MCRPSSCTYLGEREEGGGGREENRKEEDEDRNEGGSGRGREGKEEEERRGREGRKEKKERKRGISYVQCAHEYTTLPFREISGGLVKVFADGDCGSSLCVTQLDILEKSVGHKLCV